MHDIDKNKIYGIDYGYTENQGHDYVTALLVLIALAPVLCALYWVAVIFHFV